MDNYSTPFCLLTHLEVNNIWATGVLNKNGLRKCTIIGRNSWKKKESDRFKQCKQSKKAV